jgi:hypothetical protein
MKKQIILLIVAFLVSVFTTTVYANHNTTFSTETNISESSITNDEAEIYSAFDAIEEVVTYVETTENVTYSDLKSTNFALDSLSEESALAFLSDEEEDNRFHFTKQTAYFMGCAFGMLGILAVAIVNEGNTPVVNSSIWGCVTSGCVSGGLVAAFYVWYFALFAGYFY